MRHYFGRQPEPWSWPTSLWAAGFGSASASALGGRCILGKHFSSKVAGAFAARMLE